MSEMGSDEQPDPISALQNALIEFTGCVGDAVDVCSYSLTIGQSYVPFNPDEEEDCDPEEAMCSQLWVRVTGITPEASESWGGDCAVDMRVGVEVGIIRCIDIPEGGEAPSASDVLVAALQSMDDMEKIHCAAMSCDAFSYISAGSWTPDGPLGGQYGGIWTFTVGL